MIFNGENMTSNKDSEKKEFLISIRKRVGPGLTNAPVWVLQKAGKRIWNPKRKRSWGDADFGKQFEDLKRSEKRAKVKGIKHGKKRIPLSKTPHKGKKTAKRINKRKKHIKLRVKINKSKR